MLVVGLVVGSLLGFWVRGREVQEPGSRGFRWGPRPAAERTRLLPGVPSLRRVFLCSQAGFHRGQDGQCVRGRSGRAPCSLSPLLCPVPRTSFRVRLEALRP